MQVGTRPLLKEETLTYLQNFRLPEYQLENDGQGGYDLVFEGSWAESTLWEIYALKIVNSLYLYHYAKKAKITPVEWNGIMTRKTARLYDDLQIVKDS
jgi:nicotinate phosphoribosyltransferase